MNTALLVVGTLIVSQASQDPLEVADLSGTHSVLVKTTSLVGAPTPAPPTAPVAAQAVTEGGGVEPAVALATLPTPPDAETPNEPEQLSPQNDSAPATTVEPSMVPINPVTRPPSEQISIDAGSVPAAGGQPSLVPVDVPGQRPPVSAQQILQTALAGPARTEPGVARILLRDILAGASDRQVQLQRVLAYWQLSAAVASYHFAIDEHDQLARLREPAPPRDVARLQAARAAASARLREAELTTVSMQYALSEMVPEVALGRAVMPGDPPFVGVYRTQFESLFANRPAPAGLLRIDRTLPLRLALIDARAAAIEAAEQSTQLAVQAHAAGEASLHELLHVVADLRARREGFLAAVRDYNVDIAAYALAVASDNVGPEILVSMLIESTPPVGSVLITSDPTPQAATPLGGPTVGWPTPAPVGGVLPHVAPSVSTNQPTIASPIASPGENTVIPAAAGTELNDSPPAEIAPADSLEPSGFRDVTPSQPVEREVLVPAPPARYRPPGAPAAPLQIAP
jgi:hypothetical protein